MTSKQYVVANVFTERRFGGNQLAVLTDARGLSAEDMQDIAREFNLSETTFLLPPEQGGDFRVRIFTPVRELPFAGHPLVGSGFVIVSDRMKQWERPVTRVALETGVGKILVETETQGAEAGFTRMTQPSPAVKEVYRNPDLLMRAFALDADETLATGLPIEAIDNGITTIVVPLRSLEAVRNIRVNLALLDEIIQTTGAETVLAFTRETVEDSSTVHCRVLAPAAGVIEDAATGSANGPLGYYMVRHNLVPIQPVVTISSEQGYEMNRPSKLTIEIDVDSETREVTAVRVGGGVLISARGRLYL